MAEEESKDDRPFVERWMEEQQEWQKTMLTYMDTMANNEEFLTHLGNAMRGSLLAGKPYPGTTPASAGPESPDGEAASASKQNQDDDRLDRILFALHELQGQLNDLQMTVEGLVAGKPSTVADSTARPETVLHFGADPHAEADAAPAPDRERDD
jgi:hypothetical protein